jgi:hypothetical protein
MLFDAEHANLLVIFDCCEAGNLCKSRSPARFEYLAACGPRERTKPAGPESFTRALIWSLKELRNHERGWYPTSELRDKILRAPDFPKTQFPQLAPRIFSPDHIVLAPLSRVLDEDALEQRKKLVENRKKSIPRWYLDLRLEFHERLSDEVFVDTGKALRTLIQESKIKAKRITFIEKHGKSRWPALLTFVTTALRFSKNQIHETSDTQSGPSGNETRPEVLTTLLNNRLLPASSSLRPASPSPLPGRRRQSIRITNGLTTGNGSSMSSLGRYRLTGGP